MNKFGFYFKMAGNNIIKNGKFYMPFILISMLSVSMFYNMASFCNNDTLPGGASFLMVMQFGMAVIAFFCSIFMFYTNSFLIKRRKKELGLYNILGMDKRHVAKIIFWENTLSEVASIVGGIVLGLILDRLLFMVLRKILHMEFTLSYQFSLPALVLTVAIFAVVFALILAYNLIAIMKAKPVELLAGGKVGEKEPKVKWLMAVLGVVTLGGGYYMALTCTNAIQALTLFFIAVILVIIGTYLLFNAGSIAALKALKNNKNYYYDKKHFSTVSGMIYRMKQNATGLANICILSTMVLVMVSTTVSLYGGMSDIMERRFPQDIMLELKGTSPEAEAKIDKALKETEASTGIKVENMTTPYTNFGIAMMETSAGKFTFSETDSGTITQIQAFTKENFKKATGIDAPEIKEGQIGVFTENSKIGDTVTYDGKTYDVVHITGPELTGPLSIYVTPVYFFVYPSQEAYEEFFQTQYDKYINDPKYIASKYVYNLSFDTSGTDEDCAKFYNALLENPTMASITNEDKVYFVNDCLPLAVEEYHSFYGGFLFLGLYLGFLFLMFTVISMYYKQLVEGYEDKEKYRVMRSVGMSREEVRKTIKSQILTMFFLPLIAACIHICFAFPMLKYLLAALNLTNVNVFIICTIITVVVYTLVYAAVYVATSKTYYKIVSSK